MSGTKNDVLVAKNADFTQVNAPNASSSESNGLVINGQLWIGSTSLNPGSTHINVGTITSPGGTVLIGYSSPNITLAINSATVGQTITGNSGGALSPTAGNWNILGAVVAAGTTPVATAGSVSTLTVNVQTSQALAAADATKIGLSNFDSAAFDVSATGFVQLNGGGIAATSFDVQANTAPGTDPVVPTAAGVVTVNGSAVANHSVVIETRSRAANAYNLEVQYSTTAASTDATKSGVAHFNSSEFTVDANGFVSIITGGMPWTDVTGATQALSVQNGYVTDRGAGVTYTLPATATFGDVIKIDGKLGITTIAQNANQAIRVSSSLSTTGVGGSVVGTNVGDCMTLRCTTGGASTIWIAENLVGNWIIT